MLEEVLDLALVDFLDPFEVLAVLQGGGSAQIVLGYLAGDIGVWIRLAFGFLHGLADEAGVVCQGFGVSLAGIQGGVEGCQVG